MLAYVFWHWPQPTVDPQIYRNNLLNFHRTLVAHKPQGFHNSTIYLIGEASWLDTTGPAYEEWYLLDNTAAMDPLNEGAVSGPCELPHNTVARDAAGGIAGLYRLQIGSASLSNKKVAVRFSKPQGVSYQNFFAGMRQNLSKGAALWQRQMTLGPTTEFCLLCESQSDIPSGVTGTLISLELVFAGS